MSFFFALYLLARSFSFSLSLSLFLKNKCVCIFFFFSLCLCVRVSSNSLNEVFLHTQIKNIQKDEQESGFSHIIYQMKPSNVTECHEIFQVFNSIIVFLSRKKTNSKVHHDSSTS